MLAAGSSLAGRLRMAAADITEGCGYWRLIWTLGLLDIRLRYRGSVLGPFWLTLSTGLMVAAMGVLYSGLFHQPLATYLPYLALSLTLWNFVSAVVNDACIAFTSVEPLVRSVRMPFFVHAARSVVRNVLILAHNLLVIVVVFIIVRLMPHPVALIALPAFALWLVDAMLVTLLLGTFCARYRDVPPIVGSVMQIAFFISPILWSPSALHGHAWLLPYDPFYSLFEIVRGPFLGTLPDATLWLSAGIYSLLLALASVALFARARGRIAFWL